MVKDTYDSRDTRASAPLSEKESMAQVERRPITQAELQLLADAWRVEFPELAYRQPGEVLSRWRRIAERHRLCVEHTPHKRDE